MPSDNPNAAPISVRRTLRQASRVWREAGQIVGLMLLGLVLLMLFIIWMI